MELVERQKAVADAILLERAAKVLKRRFPDEVRAVPNVMSWLSRSAQTLRQEAESGG